MLKPVFLILTTLVLNGGLLQVARGESNGPAILTQHNDVYRSGVNRHETVLNVDNVQTSFGKLWEVPVKGSIFAQPLYVPNVRIRSRGITSKHNVVIVATIKNLVYAIDADQAPSDSQRPYLWKTQLGKPFPDDDSSFPQNIRNMDWTFGVMGTPVIDDMWGWIYLVSFQYQDSGEPAYFLYKLRLKDGSVADSIKIQGSLPGDGYDSVETPRGRVIPFRPTQQLQRPGLLLHDGFVHIAFGSMGDKDPFHGWLFSYRADGFHGGPSFITTPNDPKEGGGGIWQSAGGLTIDGRGNFYLATGNGAFSAENHNWGDSVLKLGFDKLKNRFKVRDYFTPPDQEQIDKDDMDLGAAGVVFIPPRYILSAGKPGKFFLLDRDHMGGYHPNDIGKDQQEFGGALDMFQVTDTSPNHRINGEAMWNIHGQPVFWDGNVYVMGESDPLKAYRLDLKAGRFDHTPVSKSRVSAPIGMPGGFITVSSDGNKPGTGVVWVSHPFKDNATWQDVAGVLRAFDAKNLDHELWNSLQNPGDDYGLFAKFCVPTVTHGKVYMATFSDKLVVYGLKNK